MNIDLLALGNILADVVGDIAYFVIDIFVTPLASLMARYIEQAEGFPILQAVLEQLLDWLVSGFPDIASLTFFEFCCGSALLLTLVIQLAVWVIDILSPD